MPPSARPRPPPAAPAATARAVALTRVYLVDDHAAYRACLRELLHREPGLALAGEAADPLAAVAAAQACAPRPLADVVLLDVAMPGMNGIALAARLRALAPGTRVMALSMHDDPAFALAMFDAGASAYLLKNDPLPDIVAALRAVACGERACSGSLDAVLHKALGLQRSAPAASTTASMNAGTGAAVASADADVLSANLPAAIGAAPMVGAPAVDSVQAPLDAVARTPPGRS